MQAVLGDVPKFRKFCSVAELHRLVEEVRHGSAANYVKTVGQSRQGRPIHHVSFGKGAIKALFVAYPHCSEPVGGLTVFALLTLLKERNASLMCSDVEWHIVPCIDPDGAVLNEEWSQYDFEMERHMRGFHKQEPRDQVELSFPIQYKRLRFAQSVPEGRVLQRVLNEVRPDFYYSLHNAWSGGAYFLLSRDIGAACYREFYSLLDTYGIVLQRSPAHQECVTKFSEGIFELATTRMIYDSMEKSSAAPEEAIHYGACSWEYLADIKGDALSFLMELPYVRHPNDVSEENTGQSLRQCKLLTDADSKYVAATILEEWAKVGEDLNKSSPFYTKIFNGLVEVRERLCEGLPSSPYKTRDVLFNAAYSRTMTEADRLNENMLWFYLLCNLYEFVRLLRDSRQTSAVKASIGRFEAIFESALRKLEADVSAEQFEVIDYDSLAQVQLGSGLIAINSLLCKRAAGGINVQ